MPDMIVVPESVDSPIVRAADKPAETLSFKADDFAADMAKIAAEQGATIAPKVEPPTTPVQPITPATVTPEATKAEVPEKFKNADGSVDMEKLNKSIANVDEALASYLVKEKELKRKMNDVKANENKYLHPPTPIAPTPVDNPISPEFAAQIEADIAAQGAGVVLARLHAATQAAAEERMQGKINELLSVHADATTKKQIEDIAKVDSWVLTPEGHATLTKVLEEQPYLWQAPDPYKAAYLQHRGNVVSQSSPQVLTPNPIARPAAPVLPGQAASQANNGMNPEAMFDRLTPDQKADFINRLPANEQEKWFIKAGFPKFNSRK